MVVGRRDEASWARKTMALESFRIYLWPSAALPPYRTASEEHQARRPDLSERLSDITWAEPADARLPTSSNHVDKAL